ncbi:hypothetical protein ACJMK2_005729 [Sinanodonta woodiana]|uniref:Uncharacterized protein n=1 Tax=Sinanodonta woodiana TaxID=1069815 RepID=A0ABD3VR02_SINWO
MKMQGLAIGILNLICLFSTSLAHVRNQRMRSGFLFLGSRTPLIPSAQQGGIEAYERTSGEYGSYRQQPSWQLAALKDNARHLNNSSVSGTAGNKDNVSWILSNMKSLTNTGNGIMEFWNSYAPKAPPSVVVPLDINTLKQEKQSFKSRFNKV